MARLFRGEADRKQKRVENVLNANVLGITETEAADLLGWDRRTVNNYLRNLAERGKAMKSGRSWFGRDRAK